MVTFAFDKTPSVKENWKKLNNFQRVELIYKEIKKDERLNEFEVFKATNDGQIVFKVNKTIPVNERGMLLLGLEERLKQNIDEGLTVWFEPVGDKSKLRNLRGIKINKDIT